MIKPALSDLFTRPPTHARPAALSLEKEMRSMLPSAASVAGAAAALNEILEAAGVRPASLSPATMAGR